MGVRVKQEQRRWVEAGRDSGGRVRRLASASSACEESGDAQQEDAPRSGEDRELPDREIGIRVDVHPRDGSPSRSVEAPSADATIPIHGLRCGLVGDSITPRGGDREEAERIGLDVEPPRRTAAPAGPDGQLGGAVRVIDVAGVSMAPGGPAGADLSDAERRAEVNDAADTVLKGGDVGEQVRARSTSDLERVPSRACRQQPTS